MNQSMKILKRSIVLAIILMFVMGINVGRFNRVFAETNETKIILGDSKITIDGESISEDTNQSIYLTKNTDTNEDVTNSEEYSVVNITKAGTYRISGSISNGQIAVNAGSSDEVKLILDNVDITCKTAPAIIIYNALDNEKAGEAGVTILLADNSENKITGSHLPKKASYTENGETKTHSKKYDGAISSDVSLILDGNGKMTINADNEGIEVKMHLTINGGEYDISSKDDGINANEDNVSIITINDGIIHANVSSSGDEGDGIDSNGYIYINGGTVLGIAHPTSPDSGLDSDCGIYINGGTVIGTGNMVDEISTDSKQKYIFVQFANKISSGTLVTITDKNDNPIMAFENEKSYQILLYSTPDLDTDSYKIYTGGSIEGESNYGLYTNITSYTKGTEANYSEATGGMGMMGGQRPDFDGNMPRDFDRNMNNSDSSNDKTIIIAVVCIIVALALAVGTIICIVKNEKKDKNK